jgi:hypothetical protein
MTMPDTTPIAERDREDPDPEIRDTRVDLTTGEEAHALCEGDVRSEADRESREQDVEGDDPHELQARQEKGIEMH